ncbi:hypothetical protein BJY00DRAFT_56962 [Aspergillus carlsbadensis]|nr:hypothetical protein BJY00DRAFT_56962 [Aspergillus carlsbadensis]
MKTFTLPMAFLATVGAARAQLSVSECANMCLANMLALANELGCDDGDLECLCETPDYRYGIRDCTAQACPGDDAYAVLNAALEECPDPETETETETTTGAESASSTIITGSDGTTTLVPVPISTGTDGETTTSGSGDTTTPGGPHGPSTPGVSPTATSTPGQSTSTAAYDEYANDATTIGP